MRKKFLLFPVFLVLYFSFTIYGQTVQVASGIHTQHKINSAFSAKETYEKAYKMAEAHGETELAKSAKTNFQRLFAKIN